MPPSNYVALTTLEAEEVHSRIIEPTEDVEDTHLWWKLFTAKVRRPIYIHRESCVESSKGYQGVEARHSQSEPPEDTDYSQYMPAPCETHLRLVARCAAPAERQR